MRNIDCRKERYLCYGTTYRFIEEEYKKNELIDAMMLEFLLLTIWSWASGLLSFWNVNRDFGLVSLG